MSHIDVVSDFGRRLRRTYLWHRQRRPGHRLCDPSVSDTDDSTNGRQPAYEIRQPGATRPPAASCFTVVACSGAVRRETDNMLRSTTGVVRSSHQAINLPGGLLKNTSAAQRLCSDPDQVKHLNEPDLTWQRLSIFLEPA